MITIKKIYLEDFHNPSGGGIGTRLICEIDTNGKKDTLFLECEQKWKKYLLTERADAFVVLLLPVAMREKHDIASYLPITEALKNAYLGNRETGLFFSGESGAYINEIKTVKQVVKSLFGKDGI